MAGIATRDVCACLQTYASVSPDVECHECTAVQSDNTPFNMTIREIENLDIPKFNHEYDIVMEKLINADFQVEEMRALIRELPNGKVSAWHIQKSLSSAISMLIEAEDMLSMSDLPSHLHTSLLSTYTILDNIIEIYMSTELIIESLLPAVGTGVPIAS